MIKCEILQTELVLSAGKNSITVKMSGSVKDKQKIMARAEIIKEKILSVIVTEDLN